MNNQDIISRSALIADIGESVVFTVKGDAPSAEMRGANKIMSRIDTAPAADVAPVVHGEWRWAEDGHCKCTVCGQYATVKRVVIKTNFCPNCGADMRERKTDE